jgi:hypothetical protein
MSSAFSQEPTKSSKQEGKLTAILPLEETDNMEILEAQCNVLTNWEVHTRLTKLKAKYKAQGRRGRCPSIFSIRVVKNDLMLTTFSKQVLETLRPSLERCIGSL